MSASAFNQIDANGDGQISREEWEAAMAAQGQQVTYTTGPTTYLAEPVATMQGAPATTYASPPAMTMAAPMTTMMAPIITTAEPVYITAPEATMARSFEGPITTSEPVPVSTNMMPPVPMSTKGEVMMGGVTQMKVAASVMRDDARATHTSFQPTMSLAKELGQAVYVTGPTTERSGRAHV